MVSAMMVTFFVLVFLGVPIAFVIGVSGMVGLFYLGDPMFLSIVSQRMFAGLDNFSILAIPFFFLAGELMSVSKVMDDLVSFAYVLVGRLRGGLGHVNIISSLFFAGITGSAVSDVAALGPIEVRAMEKGGYDRDFSAALTVASSLIGPIIPPSGIMILYGSIVQVSVAGLFVAGILPGILLAGVLMIAVHIIATRRQYPVLEEPVTIKQAWESFRQAAVALMMPVIILGGIIFGVFTPTEAAAVAALYALIVGFAVKRTLRLADLPPILYRVGVSTAAVFIILAVSSIFSWVLAFERIPEHIAAFFLSLTDNKWILLFLINIMLLIVGMFLDNWAALIILAPILAPTVAQFGIHPMHFGIIMSINLLIGLVTAPVGQCLFVACSVLDLKFEKLWQNVWPLVLLEVGVLLVLTYVPEISLFLPRLLGYVK